jgi:hypothetical protein
MRQAGDEKLLAYVPRSCELVVVFTSIDIAGE